MSSKRLDLDHLQTLLVLAESNSFNEAGARIGLAQSTVSQHLRHLEKTLGTPLIIRGKRGCKPTAAALRLMPYAKSLLRLERRVVNAADGRTLHLGACSNIGIYVLPHLLREFERAGGQPPALCIGSNPEVVRNLEATEIDAALLEWWDERDGFHWQAWCTEPLVVIVAPGHPMIGAKSVSRAELAKMALIGGEDGTGTGRLLRNYFGDAPMPSVSMRLGSTEAVKRAVEAGLGASLVLACAVEQEVRAGRLCAIPMCDQSLQKSLRLVWRNDFPQDHPLINYLAGVAAKSSTRSQRDHS
jgi:DNA-binding transcriptional LysR family regulator